MEQIGRFYWSGLLLTSKNQGILKNPVACHIIGYNVEWWPFTALRFGLAIQRPMGGQEYI